jgi:hypothetical protein
MSDFLLLRILGRKLNSDIGGLQRSPTATLVWSTDREGFVWYRKPRKLRRSSSQD